MAELAALIITDDSLRAEPVPDLTETLALLRVPGSVLEGPALARFAVALAAAQRRRGGAGTPRARRAAVRGAPRPLAAASSSKRACAEAIDPDGRRCSTAPRAIWHARVARCARRAHKLVARLERLLGDLDPQDRAPDAAVTVRAGRYVIPVRSTARSRVGGIVHDESATRATVFVEPPEVIELGNELRDREADEQREVLRVLRELTDAAASAPRRDRRRPGRCASPSTISAPARAMPWR